jgi:hypothetical protein
MVPPGADPSIPEPDNVAGITPARPKVFSRAHVAAHGLLGLLAVILVSSTASGPGEDSPGLAAGITLAVVVTAVVAGLGLFIKWQQARDSGDHELPERRLPVVVVVGHGVAALVTLVLAVGLVINA